MQPRFFNTLTRTIEPFEPLEGTTVRMYTCGPTVHDYAHIGNFRAYVFEDLLRRVLKFHGWGVRQVMNLTDVDDKTIRKSRAAGLPLREYTARYIAAFFEDLDALRIERAEHYPAATDHVPDMIRLIERLIAGGFAYRSEDGSVYFRIERFPAYGRLARLDLSGLKPGARVAQDEYEKEHVGDFALWKAWDESDGDVAWDSPWGRGRPGWHIECSAMSMRYLGESFDIHTGGQDNIFPHHEDEIAQSEAATGRPLARFWLHCAHLIVEGRKMSKSLNNFFTLRDLLERGWTGREVRYVLLGTQYRQSLNFTFDSLGAARAALRRLDEFRERLQECAGGAVAGALPAWAAGAPDAFRAALADDLNISGALGVLFDLVRDGHRAMDAGALEPAGAAALLALLADWDRVLAVLRPEGESAADDAVVQELLCRREAARKARNWAEADRLRAELAARGWLVQDTPQGPKLRRR
ncbi:MAG: cysteine--tRNA ligase [Kiritimatiellae bacterium]|nr:cysteine--tRNA ligase [Kiritimatiellia bacterium]